MARRGAAKARIAALNQLHSLTVAAPQELRDELTGRTRTALLRYCASLPVDEKNLADPVVATRAALRAVGRFWLSGQWHRFRCRGRACTTG